MRIVIGSGKTSYEGWLHTQETVLNLLKEETFTKLIPKKDADCFLAEHVWEHLDFEEGVNAAKFCFNHLKDGGYIRVAVPDKNFRNEWYQNMVQIGGPGPKDHPAATHKIVHDYKTISEMFKLAGFEVSLLEYCDEDGNFIYKYWNNQDGHIARSYRYDTRNSDESLGMISLIIDAHKTIKINPA